MTAALRTYSARLRQETNFARMVKREISSERVHWTIATRISPLTHKGRTRARPCDSQCGLRPLSLRIERLVLFQEIAHRLAPLGVIVPRKARPDIRARRNRPLNVPGRNQGHGAAFLHLLESHGVL